MEDEEIRARVLNRFFNQYAGQDRKYSHSEYIHHDKNSPKEIIPILIDLIGPRSVVDVGCGLGAWLKVFQENGIVDVLGIEGEYAKKQNGLVTEDKIAYLDLENLIEQPSPIDRKFDLAICLEVAEHLRSDAALPLVKLLTDFSEAVLFSAAVPYQGGINHVNEQWIEYWQELFNRRGYEYYDLIRPKIWKNEKVKWWYKQNIFLVLKKGKYSLPKTEDILNIIHPELFLHYRMTENSSSDHGSKY